MSAVISETNVAELYAYSPYGETQVFDASASPLSQSALGNCVLYTGRYLDTETGLYQFRAPYFDPALGRFLNRDPIGYADGLSLYAGYFAPGTVDPSGTQVTSMPYPYSPAPFTPHTPDGFIFFPKIPAGNVDGLADHLKRCCNYLCDETEKFNCNAQAEKIESSLKRTIENLNVRGITRFEYAGNTCTQCTIAVDHDLEWMFVGPGPQYFTLRSLQNMPLIPTGFWAGHAWHEIVCNVDAAKDDNLGFELDATIDFWEGSGDGQSGWKPARDGFGWSPNALDGIPYTPPPHSPEPTPLYICFIAGTPVLTQDGLVDIEKLERGILVWAYDHEMQSWQLSEVEELQQRNHRGEIVSVTCDNDFTMEMTGTHPVWVAEGENLMSRPHVRTLRIHELEVTEYGRWVEARDLECGDVLFTRDGTRLMIQHVKKSCRSVKVYNISVKHVKNYGIGEHGILVHNS